MSRADAMTRPCPKCGAPARMPCMGRRGARLAVHSDRMMKDGVWPVSFNRGVRASRCNVPGWVYFIGSQNSDLIKIGWTSGDPWKRLAMLQTGNGQELFVFAKMPGTQRDEKALHARFNGCRQRGEWFLANDELSALIRETMAVDA